mgnify:CR=1 FL=1
MHLSADIVDAKVFSGAFSRNDPGEIGPGEGLDRALEDSDTDSQNPELILFF